MLHASSPGDMSQKENVDIAAWRNFRSAQAEAERFGFLHHKLSKLATARKFLHHFDIFESSFQEAKTILEIGGGSCWASHLVKLYFPDAVVIGSDVAQDAVSSRHIWEPVIGVKIDDAFACTSYEIPMADASVDLVFCFEAAHHFGRHGRTFRELARVVKKGGKVLYLDEPTCPKMFYKLVHKRNNQRDDHVPEDILLVDKLLALARESGFDAEVRYVPHSIERGEAATLYYAILRRMPWLAPYVPCTADFVMTRR